MYKKIRAFIRYHISDIVYGANDGIITTFAVISSAAGAGFGNRVIIILGIANLIADGFSMGASKYLSETSEKKANPDDRGLRKRSALMDGFMTFASFGSAGALPLIPFVFPAITQNEFGVSIIATALALLFVGGLRSLVTKQHPLLEGLEMLAIGGFAASIAYGLGWLADSLIALA